MPDEPAPSESTKSANALLLWLARDGPRWARIPAVIASLLVAITPGGLLVNNYLTRWRESAAESPAAKQLQLAAAGVISARDAAVKAVLAKTDLTADDKRKLAQEMVEMDHELGHLNNPADQVQWTTFAKKTSKDYFGWKLYPSDKCLVIARIEDGAATAEWLRDPFHPSQVSLDVPSSGGAATSIGKAQRNIAPSVSKQPLTFDLIPVAYASEPGNSEAIADVSLKAAAQMSPAQGGCLNPHPWAYGETWGAYINQCQQPVFRRWNDGCSHVQFYDHCANVWGPVVWQWCSANHHP